MHTTTQWRDPLQAEMPLENLKHLSPPSKPVGTTQPSLNHSDLMQRWNQP